MSVVWTALRRSSCTMMEDMIRRSSSPTSMMMVSRSMSSHNNNNNRNNNYRNRNSGMKKVRSNSNPPPSNRNKNNRSMTKLRNHAVSIFHGNYEDYYNNSSEEEEEAFPRGYDYEGDDPDLWTPPRKKRRTKTVQRLTHDVIIDLDTGKLKCDDLNQYLHLPTNPSLFHFCH